MTNTERAKMYRELADYVEAGGFRVEAVAGLRAKADELDPPVSMIDRSLRGWVLIEVLGAEFVRWASSDGLNTNSSGNGVMTTWDEAERYGWAVRKLTPDDIGVEAYTIEELERATLRPRTLIADLRANRKDAVRLFPD